MCGADVFVVQPCHAPVDNHLLELLLMIDAFKRVGVADYCGAAVLLLRETGSQG